MTTPPPTSLPTLPTPETTSAQLLEQLDSFLGPNNGYCHCIGYRLSMMPRLNFNCFQPTPATNGSPPVITPPSEFSGSSGIPHTRTVSGSHSQVDEEISKFSDMTSEASGRLSA
ncbi:hypothetical protein BDN67DRAFT_1015592 [Paxillus ammoniavirescens]|nr:hypothetical protein BDN67DRAFT_1015592 [Paxillus ammoniavirescens]